MLVEPLAPADCTVCPEDGRNSDSIEQQYIVDFVCAESVRKSVLWQRTRYGVLRRADDDDASSCCNVGIGKQSTACLSVEA